MNSSRKNHEFFPCQEAQTPRNEVEVFVLKSVLLYCLKLFLAANYKEKYGSFIDFSHNSKSSISVKTAPHNKDDIHWQKIPLKKQQSTADILYITALPQRFRHELQSQDNGAERDSRLQEITIRLVEQLKISQLEQLPNTSSFTGETQSTLSNLWKSFQIESKQPGWILFRLSDEGIYTWISQLQTISQMAELDHTLCIRKRLFNPVANTSSLKPVNPNWYREPKTQIDRLIWQSQYTHARCHSLIQYWYTISAQNTYSMAEESRHTQTYLPTDLASISLEDQTAQTRQLIQALIEMADDLFWLPERYPDKHYFLLLKRAEGLCRAFEQFHRAHALIRNFSPTACMEPTPHLYPILISGTCNILKALLSSYLGLAAPVQL
ncbi:MAG: hypothetical protein AAF810_00500 [Cyanobacteria bacterium P01_D01_bin.36]